jgi:hypothetical protein
VKSALQTVPFGGTKDITTILDGSQDKPRKLANLSTISQQLECLASLPHQQSPVLYSQNALIFFNFDWVMRASSKVMMDGCFPENIHDDSDFDYDFVYDGPVVGEYDSLFSPQTSTTEYAAAIQLATTSQTINHRYRYHLEAYKHLINFVETDPAASRFLG